MFSPSEHGKKGVVRPYRTRARYSLGNLLRERKRKYKVRKNIQRKKEHESERSVATENKIGGRLLKRRRKVPDEECPESNEERRDERQ